MGATAGRIRRGPTINEVGQTHRVHGVIRLLRGLHVPRVNVRRGRRWDMPLGLPLRDGHLVSEVVGIAPSGPCRLMLMVQRLLALG